MEAAHVVLTNWVSFFGTPNIILAGKYSSCVGANFHNSAQIVKSLCARLFLDVGKVQGRLKEDICILEREPRTGDGKEKYENFTRRLERMRGV